MAFTIKWSVAGVAPMPTPMLISQTGDAETDFGPVIDAFGELDRLMLLMVRGIDAIDGLLLALHGEIRVQFDH
jgi:hypothetical protein